MQDWVQQQQRHTAALETELRALRGQIGEACFTFDDSLLSLQSERKAAESELSTVELQQVSLAAFFEQQQYLHCELEKVTQQVGRVHEDLDAKQSLVSHVCQALTRSAASCHTHQASDSHTSYAPSGFNSLARVTYLTEHHTHVHAQLLQACSGAV